jgi:hypothetical protein
MRTAATALLIITCLGAAWAAPAPGRPKARERFAAYDVVIDTGKAELTAWQFELTYDRKTTAIVGLEGGKSKAFAKPPLYDPAGLRAGRIKVANFTTQKAGLPRGRSVVARLHVMLRDGAAFDPGIELTAAAQPGGAKIRATIEIRESKED